ncbi:MAG: sulfatase [Opitutales bacterium]|jgi:arylsulfatase A-like enzyme|nr:sulfatase [Opitutales bacterium]|tara:strand:+ start:310 stop:1707 length:1398 start_codon:yes stop_codon:yes gene_type:complete
MKFILSFAFFILFISALTGKRKTPNIVLFLIDDLGWKDVACYGSDYYRTPNIDKLAKEGIRFTDAYAACAVCSPTRAAIMTGKYPARLMLTEWLPSGRWQPKAKLRSGRFLRGLPLEEVTLAEALRKADYATCIAGKWHLGSEPFSTPAHHGFEVNIGANEHGNPGNYFFPYKGQWSIPTTKLKARWQVLPGGKPGEYLTDRLTDEAITFLRKHREKPFFLYFSHYAVHTPFQAKKEMMKKYEAIPKERRQGKPVYAAMVESVDDSVGRIMTTLKELSLDDDTLVIFTSDNGGFAGATNHAPLRGNKGAYYEGGIRVPLVIRWPSVTKAGQVSKVPVTSSDLYPTCLAATGLPLHPAQHRDGLDLRPVLEGAKTLDRDALFWHYPHYNSHPSAVPSSVMRKGDWKLIETFDPKGVELYHLGRDLSEATNLAKTEPSKLAELRKELEAWRKEVDAEKMEPNPDHRP